MEIKHLGITYKLKKLVAEVFMQGNYHYKIYETDQKYDGVPLYLQTVNGRLCKINDLGFFIDYWSVQERQQWIIIKRGCLK